MKKTDHNSENEIYVLGSSERRTQRRDSRWNKKLVYFVCGISVMATLLAIAVMNLSGGGKTTVIDANGGNSESVIVETNSKSAGSENKAGFMTISKDTVNDVPMIIYIPHNADVSLTLGMPDKSDPDIIFAAQAADIRADNGEILGDFVLAGKQLSRGASKIGYCSIIDNELTIGVGKDKALVQKNVESKGYFFRQFPLVQGGEVIENAIKNKAIRRALAIRDEQVLMVESQNIESFHDFSQALVDMGVSQAIYLVGSTAYGWCYDSEGRLFEFGVPMWKTSKGETDQPPTNATYIIWKKK